jgi:hypothetical protein
MRNTIFGFLILIVFGSCQTEPKDQRGRYIPMGETRVLDTETGTVYQIGYLADYFYEMHIDGKLIRRSTKKSDVITK